MKNKLLTILAVSMSALLLSTHNLFAQNLSDKPQTPPSLIEILTQMLPMFGIVFFIFFFLVIRPQQQKAQDQEKLIKELKKGDSVVTTSGIIGRVALIEPSSITLEISPNVKVKFLPSTITKKEEIKA